MKSGLSILIAASMLSVPGALAQVLDDVEIRDPVDAGSVGTAPQTNPIYVGDEPNVDSEFCVLGVDGSTPRQTWADPSACSADLNNPFTSAFAGGAPARILQVRMKQTALATLDQRLYDGILGGDHVMAGSGNFHGWFGHWTDLNGDRFVEVPDQSFGDPAVVVSADAQRPCTTALSTGSPSEYGLGPGSGDGMEVSVDDSLDEDDDSSAPLEPGVTEGAEVHTGIQRRCDVPTEWTGIVDADVVLYVTPGEFTDIVNGPLGYELAGTSTPGKRNPDYTMTDARDADDTQGFTDGYYVAPAAGFEQVWTDNGLIQTTLTEAIANAVFEPDSGRAYSHRTGLFDHDNDASTPPLTTDAVTDSDVYQSVNPALETLYNMHVEPRWGSGNPLGYSPDSWGVLSGSKLTLATVGGSPVGSVVGPAFASRVPVRAQEYPVGKDHEDYLGQYGGYMRVWMDDSITWSPLVALAGDSATYRTSDDMNFGLYGAVGVWRDWNEDGWLGKPPVPAGCPDAHACGMVQDPNSYFAVKSDNEFFETCANGDSMPDSVNYHWFPVTMTPSGGSWGPVGLYVLSDTQASGAESFLIRGSFPTDVQDADFDTDSTNGGAYNQYSFNPWDDVAYDVVGYDDRAAGNTDPTNVGNPGKVDRLVKTGPVEVHMVCTFYTGTPYYSSYEHFVLPGGNVGFSIGLSAQDVEFDFRGFLTESLAFTTTIPPFTP